MLFRSTMHSDFDILKLKNENIILNSYEYFFDKCLSFFENLKNNGVNPYIICYPKDSADVLLKYNNLLEYHIPLTYCEKSYNSTDELCFEHPNLVIENYFKDKNLKSNFGNL